MITNCNNVLLVEPSDGQHSDGKGVAASPRSAEAIVGLANTYSWSNRAPHLRDLNDILIPAELADGSA